MNGAAMNGDEMVACVFADMRDGIGGVGPLAVKPTFQSKKVAIALTLNVLALREELGIERIRVMSDAFNVNTLRFYTTRLGFAVRDTVALLVPSTANSAVDPTVRLMTPADVDEAIALCIRTYSLSRRDQVMDALALGRPLVREREGRIAGYFVPGLDGHGVAEEAHDLVQLVLQAPHILPSGTDTRFFCPLRNIDLFRAVQNAGCMPAKCLFSLSVGPYEDPVGHWLPSILY